MFEFAWDLHKTKKIRNVLILANGTVSVTQNTPTLTKPYGFFNLRGTAGWLMFNPNNFINQLSSHCREKHTLVLDGPGTGIFHNGSVWDSLAGLLDGHIGHNNIASNLDKIKDFLKKHSYEADIAGEKLIVFGVGWSRGAFTLSQMKQWIEKESMLDKLKVEATHLHFIDPVVGSPTDRLRYLFRAKPFNAKVPTNLFTYGYYSNTGNLKFWDKIQQHLPITYQINTPFFSGFIDKTENITYVLNGQPYCRRAENWLFPITHEGIVGKPQNQIEQWVGDVILADIIGHASRLSLKFDRTWVSKTKKRGQMAMKALKETEIVCTSHRKYLDFSSVQTTLFGRETMDEDNMNWFSKMKDG